jgi:hypothetical protein
MANLLQAEKAQSGQYKSRYEVAETQLSQLREESEKLEQDIVARIATFDERSKADEGVYLLCPFIKENLMICLERIKHLESQLQNINVKNTEDRAESERQSVDAKAALAARDEFQGNNPLFSIINHTDIAFIQPEFKFWKVTRLRCSMKYKRLRRKSTMLRRIINTSLWLMQETSND